MSKTTTKPKSRLGRGLNSLISVSDLPVEVDAGSQAIAAGGGPRSRGEDMPAEAGTPVQVEIPLESIATNPHQPRKMIDEAGIAQLAASIRSTGLVQPIVVRKNGFGYELIAGERRLRAARLAGLAALPAIVRDVDNFTQAQMALVENIQREDLNPIDRAQAYRALVDQLGLTQAELGNRLGEDRSSIANYLRLLELCDPVRELVRDAKLSFGHAKILAGIADILEQQRLANLIVAQDLSVRNLERMLETEGSDDSPSRREPSVSPHLLDLEKTIARQLGMRVQVRANKKGKGKLIIYYGSLDQFDELLGRMGVRAE